MRRSDFEALGNLKKQILAYRSELTRLEQKERTSAQRGYSFLRSLRRAEQHEDIGREKAALVEKILHLQSEFIITRAALEKEISHIPDAKLRLILSLHYVDLLPHRKISPLIGASSAGASEIQLRRFWASIGATHEVDSS